jgi:hypothetical protein
MTAPSRLHLLWQLKLFAKKLKQSFVVFEFTVLGDVVAFCGGFARSVEGVSFSCLPNWALRLAKFVHGLLEVWGCFSQIATHGTKLYFLRSYCCLKASHSSYSRCWV